MLKASASVVTSPRPPNLPILLYYFFQIIDSVNFIIWAYMNWVTCVELMNYNAYLFSLCPHPIYFYGPTLSHKKIETF